VRQFSGEPDEGLLLAQIRTLGYRNTASMRMIVDALRTAGVPE
jgi:hypothetical protein